MVSKFIMIELVNTLMENDLFESIIIGLIGGGVLKVLHIIYLKVVNVIYLNSNFSISGVWVTEFDSYVEGKSNIEVVNVTQNKESISFYLEQYHTLSGEVRKFRGKGIFRSGELSVVYFPINKNTIQNGSLILKITHTPSREAFLSGIYVEFAPTENAFDVAKGAYNLYRHEIPFKTKITRLFKGSYYSSYDEVLASFKQ